MSAMSPQRKKTIITFLKEYIEICKKHKCYVVGVIGAETALWDEKDELDYKFRSTIEEMIEGIYDDSGNYPADDSDKLEILSAVEELFRG